MWKIQNSFDHETKMSCPVEMTAAFLYDDMQR